MHWQNCILLIETFSTANTVFLFQFPTRLFALKCDSLKVLMRICFVNEPLINFGLGEYCLLRGTEKVLNANSRDAYNNITKIILI